ncbi:MAG TPA: CDP-alcohol phosphatidyltransferase family protein [Longimicrobiales bacterium]|nr:CDP-alcohol phosphatidyltransferase family protein [Longimicrobiales bacterium]
MPNLLTGLRLVLVPAFVVVARGEAQGGVVAGWGSTAVWIVAAAGISDILDGSLARRWNLTSRMGALMDAVADKSFQFTTLVTITLMGPPLFARLPVWLVGAVFVRDLVLLVGWIWLRHLGRTVSMEHELHGKVATVLVFLLVVGATLGWPERLLHPAAAVAGTASLLSAAAYVRRGLHPSARAPRSSGG